MLALRRPSEVKGVLEHRDGQPVHKLLGYVNNAMREVFRGYDTLGDGRLGF
jgi:hypothetical protein